MDNDLEFDKQIKKIIQDEKFHVPQLISERVEETINNLPDKNFSIKKLNKKVLFAVAVICAILPLTAYATFDTKKHLLVTYTQLIPSMDKGLEEKALEAEMSKLSKEPNKLYYVFLQHEKSAESFIPMKLNPGYTPSTGFHISNSFNSDGTVIEDEKMIFVNDYKLSSSNKEKIRRITGDKNYAEALKEIEDRVDFLKNAIYK